MPALRKDRNLCRLSFTMALAALFAGWAPLCAQDSTEATTESRAATPLPQLATPAQLAADQIDFFTEARLVGPLRGPDSGIWVAPYYYGEVFTNTRGGLSTDGATRYDGLLDLPMLFQFEKMGLPIPGSVYIYTQNTHGRGLTRDFIGDFQVISNIDSLGNIMQVSDYWWEGHFLDGDVVVRLGKQDAAAEFLTMDYAEEFVNSSFGVSPAQVLPTYPNPSMAVTVFLSLTDKLTLRAGIWDALASGGSWGFSGNDSTFTLGDVEYRYTLGRRKLPGALEVGMAYLSAGVVFETIQVPSGYAYYIELQQLLIRENPETEGDTQGLGVFASHFPRFVNSPTPLPRPIRDFVGGVIYGGLIPGRDNDLVGAGVAWVKLDLGGTNQETAFEVFYQARIAEAMLLQPDVQYIVSPSGIHRDALAVGLRFEVAF